VDQTPTLSMEKICRTSSQPSCRRLKRHFWCGCM